MTKPNRFLMPGYLWNTAKIKLSANWKKWTRGGSPYLYFKDRVEDKWDGKYELNYHDEYHSLSYFDFEEAVLFHEHNDSVTVDLILGLVYHNSRVSPESRVELIGMAEDILKQATDEDDTISFVIDKPYSRFDLSGRYLSAIVQGKAASLFVRCYQRTQDKIWLDLARKSLNHFDLSVQDGGIKRSLPLDMEWMEEYPSEKPSMVLNGFLFWLIALCEYCALSNDEKYVKVLDRHLRSAINWLPAYKLKTGLIYSMYRWNHCNVHYMAIMKYQFEHLYQLTGVPIFDQYAKHCDEHTNWSVFRKMIGNG